MRRDGGVGRQSSAPDRLTHRGLATHEYDDGSGMSRDDGFAVMDVSTDIVNDPKIRKLFRVAPDHAGAAFIAYIATTAESWKAGRRVSVDDAWPAFLPFDKAAVEALVHVGLIDARGLVTVKAWRGWFEPALARRCKARERWARHNAKRDADTTPVPRGSDVGTATSVPFRPSVPTVRQSSVDKDPLLREMREAIVEVNGNGMDEAPAGWKVRKDV